MVATSQPFIPITRPSITDREIALVDDAIRNGWGAACYEYIRRFERTFADYVGVKHAVATSSCTGAIHLALMAAGIKAGDEVIVPEITWIATVEPVKYIGAVPRFVDVRPDTWCLDATRLEAAISDRTRAIVVVHVYGNMTDMSAVRDVAQRHGLTVIEDAAEAFGSRYRGRLAGSLADAACFSFHGTKTLSTGEGGMLVTDSDEIAQRARVLNDHGRDPSVPDPFWMREYGYKYKMSNLQAAMGCAQVGRADELVARKREIFGWYRRRLERVPGLRLNPEPPDVSNSFWMPTIVWPRDKGIDRRQFAGYLREHGIDSRPFFYPLSSLPMFEAQPSNDVAYDVHARGMNLPSFHDLTEDQVSYVCDHVGRYLAR